MFVDDMYNLELHFKWFQFRHFFNMINITKKISFFTKDQKTFCNVRQELIKSWGYFLVYTDCHLDMKSSCLDSSQKRDNRTLVIISYVYQKIRKKKNNFCASLHHTKIFLSWKRKHATAWCMPKGRGKCNLYPNLMRKNNCASYVYLLIYDSVCIILYPYHIICAIDIVSSTSIYHTMEPD